MLCVLLGIGINETRLLNEVIRQVRQSYILVVLVFGAVLLPYTAANKIERFTMLLTTLTPGTNVYGAPLGVVARIIQGTSHDFPDFLQVLNSYLREKKFGIQCARARSFAHAQSRNFY